MPRLAEPWMVSRNKVLNTYRSNAAARGRIFTLTEEEFFDMLGSDCHYCGSPPRSTVNCYVRKDGRVRTGRYEQVSESWRAKATFTYNGIDRVDNEIGYVTGNCVPCCFDCNDAKGSKTSGEFVAWLDRVVKHRSVAISSNSVSGT